MRMGVTSRPMRMTVTAVMVRAAATAGTACMMIRMGIMIARVMIVLVRIGMIVSMTIVRLMFTRISFCE